jgi:cell division protease FtsH
MINSVRKKIFIVLIGSLFVTTALFCKNNSTETADAIEPVQESQQLSPQELAARTAVFEQVLQAILANVDHLASIVQHLALITSEGQIRGIDKATTQKGLEQLKNDIDFAKQIAQGEVSIDKIIILHSYTCVMTSYIDAIIKNGLRTFPDFQAYLGLLQKRSGEVAGMSQEELENSLSTTKKTLVDLEKSADSVGLNGVNTIIRRVERFNKDYKIISRSIKVFALYYLVYQIVTAPPSNSPHWINKIPGLDKIRVHFGPQPIYSNALGEISNGDQLTSLCPMIDASFRNLFHNNFISAPVLTIGALAGILQDDAFSLYRWTHKKTSSFWNYLRGGAEKKSEFNFLQQPRYRFSDVIGRNDAKQVASHIVDYIVNPSRFDRSKISPERGYLLAGPTRSGKTFFAEALAGEIRHALKGLGKEDEFHFLTLHAADVHKFGVADILGLAREMAPCVLFIDELDLLGLQRERDANMLSTFLTSLSGCMNHDDDKKIIIIGATNLPQHIDPALLQHGRIGTTLWFYHPNYQERVAYLQREFAKRLINVSESYIISMAQETERKSFEDINAVITAAFLLAKQKNGAVTEKELDQAFDRILRNIIDESLTVSEEDRRLYAAHQAGKAMVQLLLGKNNLLTKVTIKRVENKVVEKSVWARYDDQAANVEQKKAFFGKVFTHRAPHAGTEITKEDLLVEAEVALAGSIAERLIMGTESVEYCTDGEPMALSIFSFLLSKGTKKDLIPKEEQKRIATEAYAMVHNSARKIEELLMAHLEEVRTVANALEVQETLTAQQITTLLKTQSATTSTTAPAAHKEK